MRTCAGSRSGRPRRRPRRSYNNGHNASNLSAMPRKPSLPRSRPSTRPARRRRARAKPPAQVRAGVQGSNRLHSRILSTPARTRSYAVEFTAGARRSASVAPKTLFMIRRPGARSCSTVDGCNGVENSHPASPDATQTTRALRGASPADLQPYLGLGRQLLGRPEPAAVGGNVPDLDLERDGIGFPDESGEVDQSAGRATRVAGRRENELGLKHLIVPHIRPRSFRTLVNGVITLIL